MFELINKYNKKMKINFLRKYEDSLKVNAVVLALLFMLLILSPMVVLAAKGGQGDRGKKSHVVTPPGKLKEPVTPPGKVKNKNK